MMQLTDETSCKFLGIIYDELRVLNSRSADFRPTEILQEFTVYVELGCIAKNFGSDSEQISKVFEKFLKRMEILFLIQNFTTHTVMIYRTTFSSQKSGKKIGRLHEKSVVVHRTFYLVALLSLVRSHTIRTDSTDSLFLNAHLWIFLTVTTIYK